MDSKTSKNMGVPCDELPLTALLVSPIDCLPTSFSKVRPPILNIYSLELLLAKHTREKNAAQQADDQDKEAQRYDKPDI
jgi:hypothetical protein